LLVILLTGLAVAAVRLHAARRAESMASELGLAIWWRPATTVASAPWWPTHRLLACCRPFLSRASIHMATPPAAGPGGLRTITDADWQRFAQLLGRGINVESVSINGIFGSVRFSATTYESLAALPGVERVSLAFVPLGHRELACLGTIRGLKSLELSSVTLPPEGLSHLTGLERLETLRLDGTSLVEEDLEALAALPRLRDLSLANTGLPEQALVELELARPELLISDD
jgi:hypothetical protein